MRGIDSIAEGLLAIFALVIVLASLASLADIFLPSKIFQKDVKVCIREVYYSFDEKVEEFVALEKPEKWKSFCGYKHASKEGASFTSYPPEIYKHIDDGLLISTDTPTLEIVKLNCIKPEDSAENDDLVALARGFERAKDDNGDFCDLPLKVMRSWESRHKAGKE